MAAKQRARRRERQEEAPRRRRVNLAFNEAELAVLQEAARREDMAVAAWAARAALAVAAEKVVPVSADARDVLQELIQSRGQLQRIGNNLNQIARVLNSDGEVTDAQVEAVLKYVQAAVRRVDEATLQVMRERRPRL
ncbi:plasmid mobilization relaxosome protein MobC [Streptomyces thermogriseus]|uniref:Bacterial mobilisation domain-containing protein n=1 Tax=Streptomyces thermogriseus TaxID=75292 RepID=A0ABP4DIE6_9ACTN